MTDPNKNRIEFYEAIFNMVWKGVFSLSVLIAFFLVLYQLIKSETYLETAKYTSIELFLTGTVYLAFKHYFPIKKKGKNH